MNDKEKNSKQSLFQDRLKVIDSIDDEIFGPAPVKQVENKEQELNVNEEEIITNDEPVVVNEQISEDVDTKQDNLIEEKVNNDFPIKELDENKIKKYIGFATMFTFIIFAIGLFFLNSPKNSEMFNANGKTKEEVKQEFKSEFGKSLTDNNFDYADGGIKSKQDTVFLQKPLYGTKLSKDINVSSLMFMINKRKKADVMLDDQPKTEVKKKAVKELLHVNKNYQVQNYMFKPFADAKKQLINDNAKFSLEFKLTNDTSKEGFVASQNYLPKSVLSTSKSDLVLTIYTRDPQNAPNVYKGVKNGEINSTFADNDSSNPNVKKDSSIIWHWTQGEKVDFRSYKGKTPLACYSRVCYYDSKGKPTTVKSR